MNIQRFSAPTSREALAKARLAFGEGTLILSNRQTATGIEVVATAEETVIGLDRSDKFTNRVVAQKPTFQAKQEVNLDSKSEVEEDADRLSMSTLSFQDYVRERMLRRRNDSMAPKSQSTAMTRSVTPDETQLAEPLATLSVKSQVAPAQAPIHSVAAELQAMTALMEERFNTLTWLGQTRQSPVQSNMMMKLIRAGYSPNLSRMVIERLPEDLSVAESFHWVMGTLERNLKTADASRSLAAEGGIFALVGATGVGKTTTAAKLAFQCAALNGSDSVGLISLDNYRVGAQEQLRAHGRTMGIVSHVAHDQATLQDLLSLLSRKKLVMIDTMGLAPSDSRKDDLLAFLDLPRLNRLLVLNAGGDGEMLDDVVCAFKTSGPQHAILSKLDEASKLGPSLDTMIRHKLILRGVTTGQSVQEDFEIPDAEKLIRQSMHSSKKSVFAPQPADLDFFFSNSTQSSSFKKHA
jgi:flagellar biosynthesis protein FlhF